MPQTTEEQALRRFNRLYTKFIGTLNEKLLDSEFGLTEARVLYEIAENGRTTATDILLELGIDAGYLSRILRKFENDGILKRWTSQSDGRSVEVVLSRRGRDVFERLHEASNEQAREILNGLTPTNRTELIVCLNAIARILMPDERKTREITLRTHQVGDMGWVVYSEGRGYAEQFGWNAEFEALVARIVSDFITNLDAARERCWIAEADGLPVGHVFLVKHPEIVDTARLRLLFVEPSARGFGIGEKLVQECIAFAILMGYKKVVLWTQSILGGARHIYQRAGFRLVKETPHHSFGKDLIGQEWELELERPATGG